MLRHFHKTPSNLNVLFVKKPWHSQPKAKATFLFATLAAILTVGSLLMPQAHAYGATAFVMVVKTDNPGTSNATSFTIPITGAGYSYNVDCNDDGINEVTAQTTGYTCVYASAGTYTIAITGTFPRVYFNNDGDRQKLLEVKQWGTIAWTSMANAFQGCINLHITATDAPNLTNVTDMSRMFQDATSMNENINHWDVSHVTDMSYLFAVTPTVPYSIIIGNSSVGTSIGVSAFNQPLDAWDTANVVNMSEMFGNAVSFNQSLNTWDTGKVTNMSRMFFQSIAFNQPLNIWDTSKVTDMSWMFYLTPAFNQPLNTWDTSKVTDMSWMFNYATAYNQSLTNWNTSAVTDMIDMFNGATAFNQPLTNWNTAAVTNMSWMFTNTTAFNQPLTNFDTSKVINMSFMFYGATAFNQPLTNWNTAAVTNMVYMFDGATAFNQPLTNWNTAAVTDMYAMFSGATAFNQPLTNFNTSKVTRMGSMFSGASAFNQPLTNWNTSAVTDMSSMFDSSGYTTATYDQTLAYIASQALKPDVNLGALGVPYTNYTAHNILTSSPNNWIITDGGYYTPIITNPTNLSIVASFNPLITGTTVPSRVVTITIDGTDFTTTSQADGSFTYQVINEMSYGEHSLTVSATDPNGIPTTPRQISFTIQNNPIVSSPANHEVVSTATPTIMGIAVADHTVHITLDGTALTTTAQSDGSFSQQVASALSDGWHTAIVRSTDLFGTTGNPTSLAFYVHTGGTIALSGSAVTPTLMWQAAPTAPTGSLWTEVTANAPWPARYGHTTTVFNNKLWVMGGYGNGTEYNDVWSSPDGVTWTQVTANAAWPGRDSYAAAAFNGKLWVIGGCAATCNPDGDVWSSPDGVTWTQVISDPSRATTRTSYAQPMAQVFDGKLWLIGGYGENWDYTSDVWYTDDGAHWLLATDKPGWSSRSDHTTAVFNNRLWVIGGDDATGDRHDVWSAGAPVVTYTVCWDTVQGGCTYTAQTTDASFTIPASTPLTKGTWYVSVTAAIPDGQGVATYAATPYQVTDPVPVITPAPSPPVIHPVTDEPTANPLPDTPIANSLPDAPIVFPLADAPIINPLTGEPSTTPLSPALTGATLSIASRDCTLQAPSIRLVEPDGLKVADTNVTLLGGVGFSASCTANGKSADITLTLGTSYADTTRLRAYKQTGTRMVDITNQVSFTNNVVNGSTKTVLNYTVIDGGSLDEDHASNGTLVDPIVIGVLSGAGEELTPRGANVFAILGGGIAATILVIATVLWYRAKKRLNTTRTY